MNRVDAGKSAELYTSMLRPVYHGENGVRTLKELARSYRTIRKRGAGQVQSSIPELGDSMFREASLCRRSPLRMAGQDRGGRRTSAGRVLLPPTGRTAIIAPRSAPGSVDGERPPQDEETAMPDSINRSHPCRTIDCHLADPAPFSYQATALDLQRVRHRNPRQPNTATLMKNIRRSKKKVSVRGLNRNCNHDFKNLFKSAATNAAAKPGPLAGVLRCPAGTESPGCP